MRQANCCVQCLGGRLHSWVKVDGKNSSSLFGLTVRVEMCLTPESLLWLEKPCICLSTGILLFCLCISISVKCHEFNLLWALGTVKHSLHRTDWSAFSDLAERAVQNLGERWEPDFPPNRLAPREPQGSQWCWSSVRPDAKSFLLGVLSRNLKGFRHSAEIEV